MQTEAIEQEAIVTYCAYKHITMFAIPNGGKRNAKEAYFLKLSGVKAGVPDMMFPAARHGFYGLFIELKVGKNKPTKAQIEWIMRLQQNGYLAAVCYGAKQAIELINIYFNIGSGNN